MKSFILGAPSTLSNYSFQDTDELFSKVGNTGNFAFRYAIKKHLKADVKEIPWNAGLPKIEAAGDIAVLPCANMLGHHADLGERARLLSKTSKKFLAIGLGAQAASAEDFPNLPEGTIDWLRVVTERSSGKKNILVRGAYTKDLLKRNGFESNVEVLGCPSLFINPNRSLGFHISRKKLSSIKRVAVAAGNPATKNLWGLERNLYALSRDSGGSYIVQHPLPFLKFARNDFEGINDVWRENIASALGLGGLSQLSLPNNVFSFYDIQAWLECLRRHDFVIGTRIHGVALAIQAGVHAICIVHDSRTKELCETMLIPHIKADILNNMNLKLKDLMDIYHFDAKKFDENRVGLAKRYRSILSDNNVALSPHLDALTV